MVFGKTFSVEIMLMEGIIPMDVFFSEEKVLEAPTKNIDDEPNSPPRKPWL